MTSGTVGQNGDGFPPTAAALKIVNDGKLNPLKAKTAVTRPNINPNHKI